MGFGERFGPQHTSDIQRRHGLGVGRRSQDLRQELERRKGQAVGVTREEETGAKV